jgi:hypothetical protein
MLRLARRQALDGLLGQPRRAAADTKSETGPEQVVCIDIAHADHAAIEVANTNCVAAAIEVANADHIAVTIDHGNAFDVSSANLATLGATRYTSVRLTAAATLILNLKLA